MGVSPDSNQSACFITYGKSKNTLAKAPVSEKVPAKRSSLPFLANKCLIKSVSAAVWWQGWAGDINEWQLHGYSARVLELPPTPSGALGTEMMLKIHISRKSHYYGMLSSLLQ